MQEIVFDVSSIDCNPFVDEFGEEKVKEYNNKYPDSKENKAVPGSREPNVKSALEQKAPEHSAKKDSTTTSSTIITDLSITKEKTQGSADNVVSDEAIAPSQSMSAASESSKSRQAQATPVEIKTEVVKERSVSLPEVPKPLVEKPTTEDAEEPGFERKQIIDMNDILRGLKEKEEELENQLPSLKKLYISGVIEREEYDFLVESVVAKIKELDKKIDYEIEVQKIKECKESIEDRISQALLKGELRDKAQHALNTLEHLYKDGIINQKTYVDGRNQIMIREKKVNELIEKIEGILDHYVNESKERTKEIVDTDYAEVEEKINKRKNSLWMILKKSLKK